MPTTHGTNTAVGTRQVAKVHQSNKAADDSFTPLAQLWNDNGRSKRTCGDLERSPHDYIHYNFFGSFMGEVQIKEKGGLPRRMVSGVKIFRVLSLALCVLLPILAQQTTVDVQATMGETSSDPPPVLLPYPELHFLSPPFDGIEFVADALTLIVSVSTPPIPSSPSTSPPPPPAVVCLTF